MTLTATSLPSRVSRALYTWPMAPAPSGARISYAPSRTPTVTANESPEPRVDIAFRRFETVAHLEIGARAGFARFGPRFVASFRSCRSRDQKLSGCDREYSDRSRSALASWRSTLDGNGDCHGCHRGDVHDAGDEKDRHQTGTTLTAFDAKTHTVSP